MNKINNFLSSFSKCKIERGIINVPSYPPTAIEPILQHTSPMHYYHSKLSRIFTFKTSIQKMFLFLLPCISPFKLNFSTDTDSYSITLIIQIYIQRYNEWTPNTNSRHNVIDILQYHTSSTTLLHPSLLTFFVTLLLKFPPPFLFSFQIFQCPLQINAISLS